MSMVDRLARFCQGRDTVETTVACPFRVTEESVDEKTKAMVNGPIHPVRGTCTLSYDRSQPCAFHRNPDVCPDLNQLDFCDKEWAG